VGNREWGIGSGEWGKKFVSLAYYHAIARQAAKPSNNTPHSLFPKPHSPTFAFTALCFLLFLLLPQAAPSQDFSSIDSDLQQLQNLINDTLRNTEAHETLLQTLKQNLDESGQLIESYETTIAGQEKLLKDLQKHLDELSVIYKMQAALSAKYAKSSKFWKIFTLIAIPATAAISAGVVWGIAN
jgi:septal ring factor EnvC (AmiA/AmiB activator)